MRWHLTKSFWPSASAYLSREPAQRWRLLCETLSQWIANVYYFLFTTLLALSNSRSAIQSNQEVEVEDCGQSFPKFGRDHCKLLLKTEPDKIDCCNYGGWWDDVERSNGWSHLLGQRNTVMAATPRSAIGCCVWDAKYKKAAGRPKRGQVALITSWVPKKKRKGKRNKWNRMPLFFQTSKQRLSLSPPTPHPSLCLRVEKPQLTNWQPILV